MEGPCFSMEHDTFGETEAQRECGIQASGRARSKLHLGPRTRSRLLSPRLSGI